MDSAPTTGDGTVAEVLVVGEVVDEVDGEDDVGAVDDGGGLVPVVAGTAVAEAVGPAPVRTVPGPAVPV